MTSTLMIGGSRIDVTMDTSDAPLPQPEVLQWVKHAAESVAAYYARFPVPHLTLRIVAFDGSGIRHGMTWPRDGGLIRILAGSKTSPEEFAEDWMLTHEMVHLAFPSMDDNQHWIEEGSATYVEPIARIQAGHWTAMQMWHDLVRDMPKGEPQPGDEGLDHTHTWGRTYWGGALFCFVADVEIRKQTKNQKGLQDALRGVLDAGGNITADWDLDKTLQVADHSVGVDVLEKLYAEWKDKAVAVDLPALWKQLGVESSAGAIVLNDGAPLATTQRAIVSGGSGQTRSGSDKTSAILPSGASRLIAVYAGRTAKSR
ncbi:MAG TPA: hypothetical protein VJN93_10780 [Candidatus Acidoferrum sp.]|nr:hypothetical protein [Candidatus Acidoferrum sp.]